MYEPYQQRVVEEKVALDEKLANLYQFFGTHSFTSLDIDEQARMRYQSVAMREYSTVLGERIAAF